MRASLIAATGELLAAHGAATVSVREIADAAGVNHGLIHHYFHSKQGLIEAVLDELATKAATSLEDGLDLDPDGALARYVVVAGRVLLEGEEPKALERATTTASLLRRLAELAAADPSVAEGGATEGAAARGDGGRRARLSRPARLRNARRLATMLGWLLFEPAIASATGLAREDLRYLRRHLLDPGED